MFFLIFKDGRSQFSFELINLALKDFEKGFQRFQFEKGVRNFPIKVNQSQVLVTIAFRLLKHLRRSLKKRLKSIK